MPRERFRLKTARVRGYCCFQDSGSVRIDDLTVLIAENENGKSSFLRALEWFGTGEALRPEDRWDGLAPNEVHTVVSVEFEMCDQAANALVDAGFVPPRRIRIEKDSAGGYSIFDAETNAQLEYGLEAQRQRVAEATAELVAALRAHAGEEGVAETLSVLEKDSFDSDDLDELAQHFASVVSHALPDVEAELERLMVNLSDAVASLDREPEADAIDVAWAFVPTFLYLDEVEGQVADSVAYADVAADPAANQTMINLARLVGLDLAEISERGGHSRLRLSETASTMLSESTSFYWEGDPITFKVGFHDEQMVVLIEHKSRTQPPSRRSRGLQWFLGFHTNFKARTDGELGGAVLLLDEPGLHLHIKQQPKLVQLLADLGTANQVIYTTHLPFMLPPSRIDCFRLLVSRSNGTVRIESDIQKVGSSHDALQPVRAALGLGIAGAVSLGGQNLIVEGFSDDCYIDAMRRACELADRPTLPVDCSLLVAGGAGKKMLPLAAFVMAEKTRGAILVDDDRAGHNAVREIERRLGSRVPCFFTHEPIDGQGESGRSTEDLFDRAFFVQLVNSSYADVQGFAAIQVADLDDDLPVCTAVSQPLREPRVRRVREAATCSGASGKGSARREPGRHFTRQLRRGLRSDLGRVDLVSTVGLLDPLAV